MGEAALWLVAMCRHLHVSLSFKKRHCGTRHAVAVGESGRGSGVHLWIHTGAVDNCRLRAKQIKKKRVAVRVCFLDTFATFCWTFFIGIGYVISATAKG